MTFKYYWEDFKVGERLVLGTKTFGEEEIIQFAREFDPQPFHIDKTKAKESFFGGIIASGWHTCSVAMRMMCDAYLNESASIGSPGVDNVRWYKPVRPGDTLRCERVILESRASESKPNIGIVKSRWEGFNQHSELVMSMEGISMFLRRTPGQS